MELRSLGQTGLQVSRLGLGLAALGRPGYINLGHAGDLGGHYDPQVMQDHCHAVLDAAFSAGVRYFDAARSYGDAERFLATWLEARGLTPGAVVVGSKWGYTYTAGWRVDAERHEIKDHSEPVLRRQAAESRALLGQHLQLYQIHSATLESGVLEDVAVLRELDRLRESGWRIGLSVSGPHQRETILRALRVTVEGRRLFDVVQATWNLLEPTCGPALAEAHAQGVGVIIKEALANGRLTARNQHPEFAARMTLLGTVAARLGCTLDALALAGVLARPWVDVVLSGAGTAEQLRSNLGAFAVAWDADAEAIHEQIRMTPDEYWQSRSGLAWN